MFINGLGAGADVAGADVAGADVGAGAGAGACCDGVNL